jgi:CubicO group peptidase (beta-lactamase class C family)
MLMEEGLLSPVMPVAEFIPELVGEKKKDVLIHHLLTHTSGLEDETVRKRSAEQSRAEQSRAEQREKNRWHSPRWKKRRIRKPMKGSVSDSIHRLRTRPERTCRTATMATYIRTAGHEVQLHDRPRSSCVVKFSENAEAAEWMSKPENLLRSSAAGGS